jgi:hypothetical protein
MRWGWALLWIVAGCAEESYDLDGGDQVTVGKAFLQERGCAECHQSPSGSDGVLSGQTAPRPDSSAFGSNLTPDHATGIGDWADIEVLRAIRYGVDDHQMPLCPTMPRYDGSDPTQPAMTDLEGYAIVAYLRSLAPVSRAIPASKCPPLKPPPDLAAPLADDGGAL